MTVGKDKYSIIMPGVSRGSWLDDPSVAARKPCGGIHLGLPGLANPHMSQEEVLLKVCALQKETQSEAGFSMICCSIENS